MWPKRLVNKCLVLKPRQECGKWPKRQKSARHIDTVQMSEEIEIILHSTHFSKGKTAGNECLYLLSLCSLSLLIFSDTEKSKLSIFTALPFTTQPYTRGRIFTHTHTQLHYLINTDIWCHDWANEAQQLMSEPYKLNKWGNAMVYYTH